jgi:hypothetical protein
VISYSSHKENINFLAWYSTSLLKLSSQLLHHTRVEARHTSHANYKLKCTSHHMQDRPDIHWHNVAQYYVTSVHKGREGDQTCSGGMKVSDLTMNSELWLIYHIKRLVCIQFATIFKRANNNNKL